MQSKPISTQMVSHCADRGVVRSGNGHEGFMEAVALMSLYDRHQTSISNSMGGASSRPLRRLLARAWRRRLGRHLGGIVCQPHLGASLRIPHQERRTPTHGYEATREAAMAAFANAFSPQRRCARFVFGRLGHWNGDLDCERA